MKKKDTGEVVIEELMVRGRHRLEEVLSISLKPRRGGYRQRTKII